MRLTIFLLLSLLTCHTFAGIKLPAKCEAGLPSLLLKKIVKKSEIEALQSRGLWGQDSKTYKYWVVYSDRCNNVTFSKPSLKSKPFDELDFNEQVQIAKTKGDFALIYTESQKDNIYPLISKKAKCRGWISMKNLILWPAPTDENGMYRKAFICLNIDSLGHRKYKDEEFAKTTSVYLHPEKYVKDTAKRTYNSHDICFVMKQENGLYLLSKSPNVNQLGDEALLGWFQPSTIILPLGNIYLEPNWKPSVVEELKGKRIFIFDKDGRKLIDFNIGRTNNITRNPKTQYRLEPEIIRFPLQSYTSGNDNQHIITAFARPDGCYDGECIHMAITGYVDKKDSLTNLDYFTPVVLLSSNELAYLMDTTKQNIQESSNEDSRDKYRKLKKIRENNYEFSFERNRITWYWIPMEDLP